MLNLWQPIWKSVWIKYFFSSRNENLLFLSLSSTLHHDNWVSEKKSFTFFSHRNSFWHIQIFSHIFSTLIKTVLNPRIKRKIHPLSMPDHKNPSWISNNTRLFLDWHSGSQHTWSRDRSHMGSWHTSFGIWGIPNFLVVITIWYFWIGV